MIVAWWTQQQAGWIGGMAGCLFGISGAVLGGLAGYLVPRGKHLALVLGGFLALFVVAGISLLVGAWAIMRGQPHHVWYPLVLIGGIGVTVIGPQFLILRSRFRQAELRRFDAELLRRA